MRKTIHVPTSAAGETAHYERIGKLKDYMYKGGGEKYVQVVCAGR